MEFCANQLSYLSAMGIDVWVSRPKNWEELVQPVQHPAKKHEATAQGLASAASVLSGSEQQGFPRLENKAAAHPSPIDVRLPQREPETQSIQSPISSTQEPPQSVTAQNTNVNPPSAVPYFQLQFWCYRNGIWFISAQQNLSPKHHQFVHNLALYLLRKKERPRHVGVFAWPMLDAPNIDQSEQVAAKYLSQHIEQLENISPSEVCISLDEAYKWLPEKISVQRLDVSLDECLNSTEEKQKVWFGLAKLRR